MRSDVADRIKDLVTALVLAGVAIGGFLFINPKGAAVTEGPGGLSWRSLPFIYSGLLLALTVVYASISMIGLRRALRNRMDAAVATLEHPPLTDQRRTDLRRLATVACLVLYATTLPMFGFALTTPVLLLALFFVFGRTNLFANLTLSLLGGFLLWLLFVGILKLPLRGEVFDPLTPFMSNTLRAMGL
ncbi:MAG: tripartite tricarboxylate transporter TctB family protein [Hyphomicrobiaceae bacterium]